MGQDRLGGKGVFSAEKKFELSGGRPQLMRNCTSSALEKPVWKQSMLFNSLSFAGVPVCVQRSFPLLPLQPSLVVCVL